MTHLTPRSPHLQTPSPIPIPIPVPESMGLVVYWYDFVCFGIIGASICGALWVIWRKELATAGKSNNRTVYESLLVGRPEETRATGHLSTHQLWTSCWRGLHPGWLLGSRLLSLSAMAAFISWDVVDWDATIFVYYTEWTFSLVMVYFALGTGFSVYGCWVHSKKSAEKQDVEENRPTSSVSYRETEIRGAMKVQGQYAQEEKAGFGGYLMQTVYQTCGGAVILTDIVFWLVIVPFLSNAHLGLNMLMGCMHSVNAAFLLLDTALNNLPFPWFRLSYFVIWSCLYIVFQWIIHAFGFPWWPYPFLELNSPWAPVWYVSLAVLHIPCYGIYSLINKAKYSILPRLFPNTFISSH